MNNELKNKAMLLHKAILSREEVIEYKRYEKLIANHPELKALEDELKDLQKQIVNAKHQQEDVSELIHVYKKKKEMFDSHPLVYNYSLLKQEVNDLLQDISMRININLSKKG